MFEAVTYPTALHAPDLDDYHGEKGDDNWERSMTNPKNKPCSLDLPHNLKWRMDGGDADGTRFFAIPTFAIGRPPLRVDIYIPDQLKHPKALRETLQSHKTLITSGQELANLGLSRLILKRLHSWSNSDPDFEGAYSTLPFGSRIVLEEIRSDLNHIPVHFIPRHDIERSWLTMQELQDMWQLHESQWPPLLDHDMLRLESQVHEAISLVQISRNPESETYAFKSISTDIKYFYHELKMLLTMPPHPHIISRPLYVVTKRCLFGGKVGVCGFILRYHPLGTLRDALSHQSSLQGCPCPLSDRLRWARQITSALLHLQATPVKFYTDLKPNNILLSQFDDGLGTVLVDFEQRGSWYSWSPPEVYYVEYLEMLATTSSNKSETNHYTTLLQSYIPDWTPHNKKARYNNSVQGYSRAWLALSPQEQEAAQVFMVGKLLWCLFEGTGSPNSCVTVETFREEPCSLAFPEFRHTPHRLRDCIRQCTSGAPEWSGRLSFVVRVGDKLFPRGRTGQSGEPEGTANETQEAARDWWRQEINAAEKLLAARVRQRNGKGGGNDTEALQFLHQRPSLKEVYDILQEDHREFD